MKSRFQVLAYSSAFSGLRIRSRSSGLSVAWKFSSTVGSNPSGQSDSNGP